MQLSRHAGVRGPCARCGRSARHRSRMHLASHRPFPAPVPRAIEPSRGTAGCAPSPWECRAPRQRIDVALDQSPHLRTQQGVFRRGGRRIRYVHRFVLRVGFAERNDDPLPPRAAQRLQRLVDDDAREPGPERGVAAKLMQLPESADVRVLQGVLRLGVVLQDRAGGAVEPTVVPAHDRAERRMVAALCIAQEAGVVYDRIGPCRLGFHVRVSLELPIGCAREVRRSRSVPCRCPTPYDDGPRPGIRTRGVAASREEPWRGGLADEGLVAGDPEDGG